MQKTLEQLQAEFVALFNKEVPNNKKNNAEWISQKIAEAKAIDQADPAETTPDEDVVKDVVDDSSDTQTEEKHNEEINRYDNVEEEYEEQEGEVDDNSVDNERMTIEARKVTSVIYPV